MIKKALVRNFDVPKEYRKTTTMVGANFYDRVEVYGNKVIAYKNGCPSMTWYFKDYNGIDVVYANMNSQFAQIVFLTGMNSKNRAIGIDLGATQNINAIKDTNRILFCAGMFSFAKSNAFADSIANVIRSVFDDYKNHEDDVAPVVMSTAVVI